MHLSVLVVGERVLLQSLSHNVIADDIRSLSDKFQDIEELSRIPSTVAHKGLCLLHLYGAFLEKDICCESMVKQPHKVIHLKALENIDLTTAEERTDDLERRILSSGSNERHDTLFYCTKKAVLLRLGESVYLVDKEYGRHTSSHTGEEATLSGTLNDVSHILHTGSDGTQRVERHIEHVGNDICQSGLPYPRRSPQYERRYSLLLYHASDDSTLANEMLLPYVFVQCLRTQSFCQWFHVYVYIYIICVILQVAFGTYSPLPLHRTQNLQNAKQM